MFRLKAYLLIALPAWLGAQSISAGLAGLVQDSQLLAVRGAAVTVTSKDTGSEVRLVADDTGRFAARRLTPGEYSVAVVAPGFSKFNFESVRVTVGEIRSCAPRWNRKPTGSRSR
jgi:hypothetical protein